MGFFFSSSASAPAPTTPGGASGEFQYNNAGAFGGTPRLVLNEVEDVAYPMLDVDANIRFGSPRDILFDDGGGAIGVDFSNTNSIYARPDSVFVKTQILAGPQGGASETGTGMGFYGAGGGTAGLIFFYDAENNHPEVNIIYATPGTGGLLLDGDHTNQTEIQFKNSYFVFDGQGRHVFVTGGTDILTSQGSPGNIGDQAGNHQFGYIRALSHLYVGVNADQSGDDASLISDNKANAYDIAKFKDNGVDAVRVRDGGELSVDIEGKGISIKEGADGRQGIATLVAGTVTVANVSVTANSRIFLTSQVDGGVPGFLRISARNAGVDFTITSSSAADTSDVAWEIFEPA